MLEHLVIAGEVMFFLYLAVRLSTLSGPTSIIFPSKSVRAQLGGIVLLVPYNPYSPLYSMSSISPFRPASLSDLEDSSGRRGADEDDESSPTSRMLGEGSSSSSDTASSAPRHYNKSPGLHEGIMAGRSIMSWALPILGTLTLLALIMWDMRKVQQLSIVIHDDHSGLWVDMNESLITDVYSPLSLCILNQAQEFPKKSFAEIHSECAISHRRERFSFCTVGSSFGKECFGSLHARNAYYFKSLADETVAFASNRLDDTLLRLATAGWALVFIGDKVSLQNLHALICALDSRRPSNVDIHQEHQGNFTVRWRRPTEGPVKLELSYVPLRGISTPSNSKGSKSSISRRASTTEASTKRSSSGASVKTSRYGEDHDAAGILNGSIAAPPSYFSLPAVQARVKNILEQHKGVAVICNAGSYYNARIPFRKDMPTLLNWLNEIGEHNAVFFRESAAQHWNVSRNGYHLNSFALDDSDRGKNRHYSCQPNEDSSPDLDWRNSDALAYITTNDLDNIEWIPFHDITAPLYSMHPSGGPNASDTDCTQYCYFPEMWQPVWNSLNKVVASHDRIRQSSFENTASGASHGASS